MAWNQLETPEWQIICRGGGESSEGGDDMGRTVVNRDSQGTGYGPDAGENVRMCVERTKLNWFHFKNRSETSGFCQGRWRLVSLLHLNQQCTRARRRTLDKLFNAGSGSSRICSAGGAGFSDGCAGTGSLITPGWARTSNLWLRKPALYPIELRGPE